MAATRRSRGVSSKSWIKWHAVCTSLVVLSGFSTWALPSGMPLPAPAHAATKLAASAAKATTRSDAGAVTYDSFDCVDPGHCGGIIRSRGETVRDWDLAVRRFASSWASDWNRWAEAHVVRQQILMVGCHYLPTERYYLCAVQVRLDPPELSGDPSSAPGTSCGLIVVSATIEAGPNDRIVNGLKTTCHIFSTYPRQVVASRRTKSSEWLELSTTRYPTDAWAD
jgi:hypothetical protein